MIETNKGDLLSAKGFIVHGCNSKGVMGSGVAKQIREKYPQAYKVYNSRFKDSGLKLGTNTYYETYSDIVIVNAITQEHYGRDKNILYVDYEAVRQCFKSLNYKILYSIPFSIPKTVNFPLIGCGLANGDWDILSKIIDEELDDSIKKVLWLYK